MTTILQHLRVAVLSVRRAPGFALTAILTLALGIGLSTAVFTVANALLLRSLPIDDQSRVVTLWGESGAGGWTNLPLTLDQVRWFERSSRTLQSIAFFTFRGATPTPVRVGDQTYQARLALVSGNFFQVVGAQATLGRLLQPEDDVVGAAPVIVLSHRAWTQRFAKDSSIVGQSIYLLQAGRPYLVVGILPQGLEYPTGAEAWVPIIAHGSAGGFLETVTGELDMLGRLLPGASPDAARAELTSFFARPEVPAWQRGARGVVHSLPEIVLGDTRPALIIVSAAAALLLIITCVNVANLLLVRALGRARDFVVRSALGATRGRLIALQLTECGLLSLGGGLLGVVFATIGVRGFVALAPPSLPRLQEIVVDGAALAAAVVITALALLLSGLGPAVFVSRADAQAALRAGSHHTGSRRVRGMAEVLVVVQIALAAVSLSSAVLLTRSWMRLAGVALSFEANHLLVAELTVPEGAFDDTKQAFAALGLVKDALEALPGVEAVSPVLNVPFVGAGGGIDGPMALPGQSREEAGANPILNIEVVPSNYFATLEIPVRGRAFADQDFEAAPPVVIMSAGAAHHFWPTEDPVGKSVQTPGGGTATIVGVVPETRYRELEHRRPTVYFPFGKGMFGSIFPATLLVRTSASPLSVAGPLRQAFAEANSGLVLLSVAPLETLLDAHHAEPRLNATVLVVFATAAVSLAAIGLFGIIGTMVRQRTRELAIRMALGGTAGQVGRMVLTRGVGLAGVGALFGVVGALATSRVLSGLLFEIKPTDGVTLLVVTGLLLVVAVLASYIPARAGMRIHPGSDAAVGTLGSSPSALGSGL